MRDSKKREIKKQARRKIAKRILVTSGGVALISGIGTKVFARKQRAV